ncbi:MAG TPA: hypothetical protein VH619_06980 [Verrucomicrobiae bacterium]|nr:hypothetical protein [Verrucomicrobiae bacterium]
MERRPIGLSAIILLGALNASFSQQQPLLPHQIVTTNTPPLSPSKFNPDTGGPPLPNNISPSKIDLRMKRATNFTTPQSPAAFNPDPGAMLRKSATNQPFFTNEITLPPVTQGQPVPPSLTLPRPNVYGREPTLSVTPARTNYGMEPLSTNLALPRENTRASQYIKYKWDYETYPVSQEDYANPLYTEPTPDRWRIGFVPWRRYTSGDTETPYERPTPLLWDPYQQSVLKGDAPIIGQDIFLDLTARSETEFNARSVPTPSGISAALPNSGDFFGRSEQYFAQNYFSFVVDLFQGETVFQPVHWAIRLEPVFNVNYLDTQENGVVSPNTVNGTGRTDDFLALQQAFLEIHLGDLSDNYDFAAIRLGLQPFNSDFRGFIFNDVNSAARLFGNAGNNRWQYNVAVFDMREKDSNSGLNTFDDRGQNVIIANLYKQDFVWAGYTAQWSFHANVDNGRTHYDSNGNLVRPAPLGTVVPHDVDADYFGWAGDGHIGRLNLTHAFYEVIGKDTYNGLAGGPVQINAQMAALEASYDHDWIRYKASIFYASGDKNPTGHTATGFDSIFDNPNFTGGPFSWYVHQGIGLGGTSVNLKQDDSLVPDLRSSKIEGQANFDNPGLFLAGIGTEIELTPKLRNFINLNYIQFMDTEPLQVALMTSKVANDFGWDLSTGFQYRPLLTDNIIVSAGLGILLPGPGYRDIYQTSANPVPGYSSAPAGHVDDFLYNVVLAVTFTY